MKIAIMSDIHANADAFRVALDDVRSEGCGRIVCLGDIVGYGPDPVECVELARRACDLVIMGNHDAGVSGAVRWAFNDYAKARVMSHAKELPVAAKEWLMALPLAVREEDRVYVHWLYRRTARVVVTCEAEAEWCRAWGVRCPIEVFDLKRFYDLGVENRCRCRAEGESLHVLFLGRAGDPLKGVRFLERAVAQINAGTVELRVVSNHFGDELEADWAWADVLCLPTLSENFGLVVAEALERGKPVITTDGAPAWAPEECSRSLESKSKSGEGQLIYLRG